VETAGANRSPSSSTQTIGVPGFTMARGSRRARGCTELTLGGEPRVRILLPPVASRQRTFGRVARVHKITPPHPRVTCECIPPHALPL
jgi:hypothetical protein